MAHIQKLYNENGELAYPLTITDAIYQVNGAQIKPLNKVISDLATKMNESSIQTITSNDIYDIYDTVIIENS